MRVRISFSVIGLLNVVARVVIPEPEKEEDEDDAAHGEGGDRNRLECNRHS
jgi:hypothetical protein